MNCERDCCIVWVSIVLVIPKKYDAIAYNLYNGGDMPYDYFEEVIALQVAANQKKFVATNLYSLAQAYANGHTLLQYIPTNS